MHAKFLFSLMLEYFAAGLAETAGSEVAYIVSKRIKRHLKRKEEERKPKPKPRRPRKPRPRPQTEHGPVSAKW